MNQIKRRVKIREIKYRNEETPYFSISVEDIENKIRFKYVLVPKDFDAMINNLLNVNYIYNQLQRKQLAKALVGSVIDVEDKYEIDPNKIQDALREDDEGDDLTQQCVSLDNFPFYESEIEAMKYENDVK